MIIDVLRLLPRFWIQTRPTFIPWDRALNAALDKFGVTAAGAHEATVGPFTVWISNYPYAFGYNRNDGIEQIPTCWTRMKLRRAIQAFQTQQYMREFPDAK